MTRLTNLADELRNMLISDYDDVMVLWSACEGVSLRDADSREGIDRYLRRNPGLSVVAEDRSAVWEP